MVREAKILRATTENFSLVNFGL
ncbi:DUF1661 domain-containing protein [Porphyromonas gingivalis]|nr:DUF1661 domain-containing protein [Porphyromonas gingivalis]